MQSNEFYGATLSDVVKKATAVYRKSSKIPEAKRIPELWAPPLTWGPWVDIFTQLGVVGRDRDKHVTTLHVSFRGVRNVSSFDVEISGGDRVVRDIGPGSAEITITGNVATTVRMRAKSHSLGFGVDVDVRQV